MFLSNGISRSRPIRTMLNSSFLIALAAGALVMWNPGSQASPIQFECTVDFCLERVTVTGMVPWGDGGSGGSTYGGTHLIYMDQATGVEADVAVPLADRPPACLREQMVLGELLSGFSIGSTPGTVVMGPDALKDPQYSSGDWVKLEYGQIRRITSGGMVIEEWRVIIHYMLNLRTKEVDQIKFKNTPEQACSN